VVYDESAAYVSHETLMLDSYFGDIIIALERYLETKVLPAMHEFKTQLQQFDFKMPLNFVMLPRDFKKLY
jgi:hypothetical protein